MKFPVATKTSAAFSGTALAILFMTGERSVGVIQTVLLGMGTLWFLVSTPLFVMGRRPIEYNNEWLQGKRSYFDSQKDVVPRALIWFAAIGVVVNVFNFWK